MPFLGPPPQLARQEALTKQATAFLGVSRDAGRSVEDVLSTPQPGESLRQFYDRSREYWAGKAHASSDNRGKMLRKDGFEKCQIKYSAFPRGLSPECYQRLG
jgi:hypothetical protein